MCFKYIGLARSENKHCWFVWVFFGFGVVGFVLWVFFLLFFVTFSSGLLAVAYHK